MTEDSAILPTAAGPSLPPTTVSEIRQGALVNTLAVLASNFRGIFTFLVARLLGPAALGTFSVAWAATDLLSKIGIFGLDHAVIAFIGRAEAAGDHARSRTIARVATGLAVSQCALLGGALALLVGVIGPGLGLHPQLASAISIMFLAMPGVALYRVSTASSRAMKVMRHDIFSRGFTETIVTTLAFLLAYFLGARVFAPEIAVICGTAASGAVAFLLAASLFREFGGTGATNLKLEARALLAYAAPISLYDLLNLLIMRLDVLLLACFIGRAPGVTLSTVGIYGAVVEVAGGLRKVNQAFNPIFGPVVARVLARNDHAHAEETYARVAQWMLWVLLPLIATLFLAGATILSIYGSAFAGGGQWLAIVGLACGTNAFVALAETAIMVHQPRSNLFNSAITCLVAVLANLWLIPTYGVTGAAFGMLIPYLVQGLLRYRTLRWEFGWRHPFREVRPPLLAAALATVPALAGRMLFEGMLCEIISATLFLIAFGAAWLYHRRNSPMAVSLQAE